MSAGLYVPLQANFFGDDKVILCSPLQDAYATNAWLKHNKSREWIEAYRTARVEDGKRGGRPPKSPPPHDDGPKGNPFESEKGNPFENPEKKKGTENLEGRQREEREKTTTETQPISPSAADPREDDPRLVVVVGLLAKRETDNASGVRNPGGYEHDARKRIQTERGDEIRLLLQVRPSASAEEIMDSLERGNGCQAPSTNGARPNPYDAQQVAERQRQGMTPLDRAEEAVRVARMTGDPLSIEAAEIELAQITTPAPRRLVSVAS